MNNDPSEFIFLIFLLLGILAENRAETVDVQGRSMCKSGYSDKKMYKRK